MTVVVNHLRFRDPLTDDVVQTCRAVVPRIVDGGATRAQVVRVDDTHLVLVLEFVSRDETGRHNPSSATAS